MNIYELDYAGAKKEYLHLYDLLPSEMLGLFIFGIGAALALVYFVRPFKIKYLSDDYLSLVICSIALLGMYIYTSFHPDEIFISLEHPYNLFHHCKKPGLKIQISSASSLLFQQV